MSVFMVQGASAGIIGSLLGTLLGVLLATNLNNLMPILGALIDGASLPVAVDPLQVTIIAVVAMTVSPVVHALSFMARCRRTTR